MKAKIVRMDTRGRDGIGWKEDDNYGSPTASCGSKGCKVIRLPFTTIPSWDTDRVEYKRA